MFEINYSQSKASDETNVDGCLSFWAMLLTEHLCFVLLFKGFFA